MKTPENSSRSDDNFDFSNAADNLKIGRDLGKQDNDAGEGQNPHIAGEDAVPNTASQTPQYGTFGVAPATTEVQDSAGNNPGGTAAPSTPEPSQRGNVAQNQNNADVLDHVDDSYESQRESYRRDDPRYGGGTSNWPTNEPANHTTDGPDQNNDNL
ncbi:hypothetical protein [Hymenobacter crusticola]|uniref:Uncharacterized protein n=1 Tax=Hymenobacter crusticola TaxID=1770526 RepID=A0A243W820_9BACT|nr:hypothetical protein [Hymenobacter crusticola]OUJ71217.1 hypothetical protein BXP70_22310 [Hymenobacter crusticola]